MADAKQDNKKKEVSSEGMGFKTVMGGFDKNEVNLYINKLKKQMSEQASEYEHRLLNLQENLEAANKEVSAAKHAKKTAEQAAAAAAAPVIKDNSAETKKIIENLKAESDKKIMELRKSVLDERRNVAKFDKECAMAKMSEKKIREEYTKLKDKYLLLKKKGGGNTATPVTTSNADEVMAEAEKYAKEIIEAARNYASNTSKAVEKYRTEVEAELKERTDKINLIKSKLDSQIKKTEAEQAESSAKIREMASKLSMVSSLFDSFASQFSTVNSQISGITQNIDTVCKQFNETTGQIGNVAKQINETTSRIDSVSKQITETSGQISGFAKSINETTIKINDASKKMNETTGIIAEASKQMSVTSDIIDEASKKMNGFGDTLNVTMTDIDGISKIVDSTRTKLTGAKNGVSQVENAVKEQSSASDLSAIAKLSEELSTSSGSLSAKLVLPSFDESRFNTSIFNEIKKKLKIETTYENSGSSASDDDDDEFDDNNILSSMHIESPASDEPSDDDLMVDIPDVITAPVFEENKKAPERKAPAAQRSEGPTAVSARAGRDLTHMTERPGLDSDFEDFFLSESKDDDMSGDIPLINMEGVGPVDDFSFNTAPDPNDKDFDIIPIDETAKPDKGKDLGADIYDIAIDPSGKDDNTLSDMMAEADAKKKAANKDLSPEELNFDADDALPSKADSDFGEFADLFAAGSSQVTGTTNTNKKPAFKSDANSELSSDIDLSDLLI